MDNIFNTDPNKTLYNLELHEILYVKTVGDGKIEITRVPGGWVYAFDYVGYRQSPVVFVPYNEEYKKTLKETKKIK